MKSTKREGNGNESPDEKDANIHALLTKAADTLIS